MFLTISKRFLNFSRKIQGCKAILEAGKCSSKLHFLGRNQCSSNHENCNYDSRGISSIPTDPLVCFPFLKQLFPSLKFFALSSKEIDNLEHHLLKYSLPFQLWVSRTPLCRYLLHHSCPLRSPVCDSYPSKDLSWDVIVHAMPLFFWMGLKTEVLGHATINMDFPWCTCPLALARGLQII